MRVRILDVLLGALWLAVLGFGYDLALRHLSSRGLTVEFLEEPPLSLAKGKSISAKLESGSKKVRLSVDGEEVRLTVDGGGVPLPFDPSAPGLHVARFDIGSRATDQEGARLWERAVEIGVMEGPFHEADRWHACAVSLHVGQAMLDQIADPAVSRMLPEALKASSHMPPVTRADVAFRWAGDGLDGHVRLAFASGTDLDIQGHVSIAVDSSHVLRLGLSSDLGISGTQVAVWHGSPKAQLLTIGSEVLGGVTGGKAGFENGRRRAEARIDAIIRDGIAKAVDAGLHRVGEVLPLPGAFAFEGIDVGWRYCRTEVAEGRAGTVSFDVREYAAHARPVATPGPVEPATRRPPLAAGFRSSLAIDVSPVLLNGVLDSVWRSGRLTELMNEPRWLDLVNHHKGESQLTFKVRQVEPLLPPYLEVSGDHVQLQMAETKLLLDVEGKRPHQRDARLFADIQIVPRFDARHEAVELECSLSDLAATCHDVDSTTGNVLLRPCYAELLQAVEQKQLETSGPGAAQVLALSMRKMLAAVPFKLSHIHPVVLSSEGQPWLRVSADATR